MVYDTYFAGKFTCLHYLASIRDWADDALRLISMVANRIKDNLKSDPNGLSLNARCKHGRTALHQAIKEKNAAAAVHLVSLELSSLTLSSTYLSIFTAYKQKPRSRNKMSETREQSAGIFAEFGKEMCKLLLPDSFN